MRCETHKGFMPHDDDGCFVLTPLPNFFFFFFLAPDL